MYSTTTAVKLSIPFVKIDKVKIKILLFLLGSLTFALFIIFSYTVAKEMWQQIDFDTTVKLQDKIPRRFDKEFSYLSLLGSVEVTFLMAGIFAVFNLVRLKMWAFLAWLLVIPASFVELVGKLILFHPAPPVLLHRSIIETTLPSFYIHTNFSYPSGHLIRTTFILTLFLVMTLFSSRSRVVKMMVIALLLGLMLMMSLTRVYLGEHWTSDVVGGGLLGVSAALVASAFVIGKKANQYLQS